MRANAWVVRLVETEREETSLYELIAALEIARCRLDRDKSRAALF